MQSANEPKRSLGRQKSTRIVNKADKNYAGMLRKSKRQRMKVVDGTRLEEVIKFVEKQRISVATAEEKPNILVFQARLGFGQSEKQKTYFPGRSKAKPTYLRGSQEY